MSSNNNIETTYNHKTILKTPKEAYYFFPQLKDEIDWNASYPYKTRRFIFEKLSLNQYLPFEIDKYEELKSSSQFLSIQLPPTWNQAMLMKCIQASKYNIPKTITLIHKLISFTIPNLSYDSYREILESGFLYLHGLDSNYRPIIITNASIYMELSKRYSYDHFICAIDYFINYLCENIFIHGQVENWIMIADVNNITLLKPPISLMNVFSFLSLKYLCRLSTLYIYGMSSVLNLCWTVIRKFLDEGTIKKFVFVNDGNKNEIFTHVYPSQLEMKYGGRCSNRVEYSETFYLPSEEYLTEDKKRSEKHLISEEEYINRCLEGLVIDVSPYLKKEINYRRQLNNTVYSVALTKSNNEVEVANKNEKSIELIYEDCKSNDNDIDNGNSNRIDDVYNCNKEIEKHKDKDNEDRHSVTPFKVKDEDYDTTDLNMSNSTHFISSRKAKGKHKHNDIKITNDMITIFESREENTYCCYNNNNKDQNKGLCSCIII